MRKSHLDLLALATRLLGESASIPLAIAPTGLTGLFHADGEMLGARAAEAFGIPCVAAIFTPCADSSAEMIRKKMKEKYLMGFIVKDDYG